MDTSIRDTSGTFQPWVDKSSTGVKNKEENMEKTDEGGIKFADTVRPMAFDGPLNILLLCTPIALINYWAAGPDAVSFIFSLLALAPMAERLGFVTEQLAMHTNETIGGLLNATFGNATELIVAISALSRGLYRLVQLSLLGSILSNILLVLGCSFFFGGLYQKDQRFGTISSQMNSTLLMIATMGIVLPTILTNTSQESKLGELGYSRGTSLALFLLYFAFIYFQLFSHKHLYDDSSENNPGVRVTNTAYSILGHDSAHPESGAEHDHDHDHVHATSGARDVEAPPARQDSRIIGASEKKAGEEENNDDDDEEEDVLGMRNAIIWLGIITVLVALVSDAISATIENAAEGLGMSKVFIAAILLPIVGNAAEHAGAVMFAMKGKLDLSLGVAIGSSTQIALCVLPFMVLLGWMGGYDLSLDFGGFEAATLALSVISVTFAIKDGRSDWLLGLTLCVAYFVIALGFWAHSNDDLDMEP